MMFDSEVRIKKPSSSDPSVILGFVGVAGPPSTAILIEAAAVEVSSFSLAAVSLALLPVAVTAGSLWAAKKWWDGVIAKDQAKISRQSLENTPSLEELEYHPQKLTKQILGSDGTMHPVVALNGGRKVLPVEFTDPSNTLRPQIWIGENKTSSWIGGALLVFETSEAVTPEGARIVAPPPQEGEERPLLVNPVKTKLKEGNPVIGVRVTVGDPYVVAALASTGVDFLWLDREHPASIAQVSVGPAILATKGTQAIPFVRYKSPDPSLVGPDLDLGALGAIFAFTNTAELAQRAVAITKYPPLGIRGFGPDEAARRWNFQSPLDYRAVANELVAVVVMIETPEGVANVDAIASVPGVDAIFIGANDLASFLEVPGQLDHPTVQEAVGKILKIGQRHHVPVGLPADTPRQVNDLIEQGFLIFHIPSDLTLMSQAARDFLAGIRMGNPEGNFEIDDLAR